MWTHFFVIENAVQAEVFISKGIATTNLFINRTICNLENFDLRNNKFRFMSEQINRKTQPLNKILSTHKIVCRNY